MQKYGLFAVYLHSNIITTTRYLLLNIMNLYKFDSVAISPSDVISLHKQDTWELTYVVHGRGTRTLGDETSEFSDGDLAFIPPHIPHCWTYDNHYTDECGRIEYAHCRSRLSLSTAVRVLSPRLRNAWSSSNQFLLSSHSAARRLKR